ncbi:helix-turn-helix transcriptional regulator [Streptomyces sp. NBC_01803]|uniref:helix-turn-helix transcriptional regulator n=1 Tax=Streptomyces sp. NBC_01803 TaxID=2975946 RepID=UPI002DD94236|nr:helix-turn-helix transcriptional regulator [Streptomyces sp. NBC_01803]WSA44616.1 helix-turn-helix domain-containing protein [Streptomyces sp. NBC_01803]
MAIKRPGLAKRRKACGFTQERFAEALGTDRTTVQRWENGSNEPQPWLRPRISELLEITATELDSLLAGDEATLKRLSESATACHHDHEHEHEHDELDALELARRVEASDVGRETLDRLASAFDDLAIAYPKAPPQDLLNDVRRHLRYVAHLMDARKTLREQRHLLVIGGWFSLLGATLHIDLNQQSAATARLRTSISLARQAEHSEIQAWCFETDAWRVLTDGEYNRALELSQRAQRYAPRGSSVAIQAVAQEGRARARLGQTQETYAAIGRVQHMSAKLEVLNRPEHHYQYDPRKSLAYTATTLAWVEDPAAERYAREVIARLSPPGDVSRWPRRVASAHIDLALALLGNDRVDEASDAAAQAILSGRVAPSNYWRALEVVRAIEARALRGASDLRDAYQQMQQLPR